MTSTWTRQPETRVLAPARATISFGLKTFIAVATNTRRRGVQPVPTTGKPSWTGDYAWYERLTGRAVVNWIREESGKPPVTQYPGSLLASIRRGIQPHEPAVDAVFVFRTSVNKAPDGSGRRRDCGITVVGW